MRDPGLSLEFNWMTIKKLYPCKSDRVVAPVVASKYGGIDVRIKSLLQTGFICFF
jgi:hypothetical protein